jgi:hypothetical protein
MPAGAWKFFLLQNRLNRLWGPPSLLFGWVPVVKWSKLTTRFPLVPRLRMSGAISLLPLYAFVAWTATTQPLFQKGKIFSYLLCVTLTRSTTNAFLIISFGVPPHGVPSEIDAPFLEPSLIHHSMSPIYEPPPLLIPGSTRMWPFPNNYLESRYASATPLHRPDKFTRTTVFFDR